MQRTDTARPRCVAVGTSGVSWPPKVARCRWRGQVEGLGECTLLSAPATVSGSGVTVKASRPRSCGPQGLRVGYRAKCKLLFTSTARVAIRAAETSSPCRLRPSAQRPSSWLGIDTDLQSFTDMGVKEPSLLTAPGYVFTRPLILLLLLEFSLRTDFSILEKAILTVKF